MSSPTKKIWYPSQSSWRVSYNCSSGKDILLGWFKEEKDADQKCEEMKTPGAPSTQAATANATNVQTNVTQTNVTPADVTQTTDAPVPLPGAEASHLTLTIKFINSSDVRIENVERTCTNLELKSMIQKKKQEAEGHSFLLENFRLICNGKSLFDAKTVTDESNPLSSDVPINAIQRIISSGGGTKGRGAKAGGGGFISDRELRSLGFSSIYNRVIAGGGSAQTDARACAKAFQTPEIEDGQMLIANLDSGTMIVNVVDYPTTNKLVTMIRDLWGIERTKQVLTFTAAGPGGTRPLQMKSNPYAHKYDYEKNTSMKKLLTAEETELDEDKRAEIFHERRATRDREAVSVGRLLETALMDDLPVNWDHVLMVHSDEANVWRRTRFVKEDSQSSSKQIVVKMTKDVNSLEPHQGIKVQVRSSTDRNTWTKWGESVFVTTDPRNDIYIEEGASFDYLKLKNLKKGSYYDIRAQNIFNNTDALWSAWSDRPEFGILKAASKERSGKKRKGPEASSQNNASNKSSSSSGKDGSNIRKKKQQVASSESNSTGSASDVSIEPFQVPLGVVIEQQRVEIALRQLAESSTNTLWTPGTLVKIEFDGMWYPGKVLNEVPAGIKVQYDEVREGSEVIPTAEIQDRLRTSRIDEMNDEDHTAIAAGRENQAVDEQISEEAAADSMEQEQIIAEDTANDPMVQEVVIVDDVDNDDTMTLANDESVGQHATLASAQLPSMVNPEAIGMAQVYNFLSRIPVGSSFKDWTSLYYGKFIEVGLEDFDMLVMLVEHSDDMLVEHSDDLLDKIVGAKKAHKTAILAAIRTAKLATANGISHDNRCPITLAPLDDPVIASDGFVYSRAAITRWLQDHSTSPMTNALLEDKDLISTTWISH